MLPYLFSLNGSAVTAHSVFSGLEPGPYVVTLQDANGCVEVLNALELQPDSLVSQMSSFDVLCFGGATGRAGFRFKGDNPIRIPVETGTGYR